MGVAKTLDNALGVLFPEWQAQRTEARARQEAAEAAIRRYRASYPDRRRKTGHNRGGADFFADERTRRQLREQCRDAVTNDSFVAGLMRLACNNILGSSDSVCGFRPKAKTGDREFDEKAEKKFKDWAYWRADASGRWVLRDMAEQVLRGKWRDGESFHVYLRESPRKGYTQLVESERVCSPRSTEYDLPDGHNMVQGVHMDRWGRPQRYWVADRGDRSYKVDPSSGQWINADDVKHIYKPGRYSQTRGVPDFAPLLDDVQMLNQYANAELTGAHVSACAGLWVPSNSGKKREQRADTSNYGRFETNDQDETPPRYERIEPGQVFYGTADEGEPKVIDPKKPPEQFADFYTALARVAMFGLGLPLEIFNWGATAYSTARSAMEQAKRRFRVEQNFLVNYFYTPVYRLKISQFIKNGDLDEPDQGQPWDHTWVLPGWPGMDDKKEADAAVTKLKNGLTSLDIEAAKHGMEAEDIIQQRRKIYEYAEEVAEEAEMDVEWLVGSREEKGQ